MASTSSRPRSRSQDRIFLVGYPSHQITGCKLPSKRQVLATLFYNLRTVKLNLKESARSTIQEVFLFWAKARIPTKHEKDAITKLEKLHTEWRNIQKDKNKKSETLKNKIKVFASDLDDLFDVAHQNALEMMKLEEDKDFLIKQRQKGRPGAMSGIDLKLARAEERKLEKNRKRLEKQIETEHFDMGKILLYIFVCFLHVFSCLRSIRILSFDIYRSDIGLIPPE